jgi:hypothetical protein
VSSEKPGYLPLASYVTEMHNNAAPSGVMPGATAMAAGAYGAGRYVAISCHPEGVITPLFQGDYLYHLIMWSAKRAVASKDETRAPLLR